MKDSTKTAIAMRLKFTVLLGGLLAACQVADAQRGFISFERNTLDDEFPGGYGVEVADIDGDGLSDIIALATNPAQLVWFKNPGWEKYSITMATQRNIDVAPHDIDNDGDIDVVLASEFNLGASTEGGLIQWLENPGDPVANQNWAAHYIDEVPTSHRLKWGDLNGDGTQDLVNLPIIGTGAVSPDFDVDLQLKVYTIPENLSASRWTDLTLDESLQMSHGMNIVDWDDDGHDDILTASFFGVHLFQLAVQGRAVARSWIGTGHRDAERPAIGASEVDMGEVSDGSRFLATIEPWHGNEVVVYTDGETALWDRLVIDTELAGGHALVTADLNNDGIDEIIAGGRAEPYQLYIYFKLDAASDWSRMDLDSGGIAVSGLAVADLNGDGLMDVVGVGSGTSNVVYYENSGR